MPGGGSNSGPWAERSGALPSESSLSGYKTIFLNEIGMPLLGKGEQYSKMSHETVKKGLQYTYM